MTSALILLLVVLLVVLAFEYINGFHDTANAIATVVSTKVLTPRQALLLAASANLLGALWGDAVAKTIGSGLVDTHFVTTMTILCAMLGGIIWNLLTWYFGLPSSSSHALIGGLCGASLASADGNWNVLIWSKEKVNPETGAVTFDGIWHKVVIPMITSPILGFVIGFIVMGFLFWLIRNWRPHTINTVFGKLQIVSAAYMGFGHGFADAQKTMGIIALTLFTATKAGTLEDAPAFLSFLNTPEFEVATWIKVVCAVVMAAGTWAGGWRIIKTLGHKMVKMKPVHGFAAEMTGATILAVTGSIGMPVSTTHTITTSIMGVGAAKRWNSIRWSLVERIVWAWVLTIPITALLSYAIFKVLG
ncbi:PiT family inorganic phosphate transporter [Prosthecobacter fusiformis]|uniref:PiT family inorganic phosphate transporter n=1 Tax=Prosthecobacter fusiformis TaxID=48464 RepID=A0A4R7RMM8_9BACT|nr:inorganic phosphate transporter [Prosthecobacter fusiformis]TDU66592.1 PiT family inorganic phosphate transporter [Prosthecobacter fusiformis]